MNETSTTMESGQYEAPAGDSFAALISDQGLLEKLAAASYAGPTSVQSKTIPAILRGDNVFVHGAPGCGKTLAYAIPLAQAVYADGRPLRALVICGDTSRSTAVTETLHLLGVRPAVLDEQAAKAPAAKISVVVGTAAAVLSHTDAQLLNFEDFQCIVIDCSSDAEEKLLTNLEAALQRYTASGAQKQLVLVSRGLSQTALALMKKYFGAKRYIEVGAQGGENKDVTHVYYELPAEVLAKPNALCQIIHAEGAPPTAVFCNEPSDADLVDAVLRRNGISSRKLIGHVPSRVMTETIKQCLQGEVTALVLTDVSARGAEIEQLSMVINYSTHNDPEVYLHRAGQGGGNLKKIVSLIAPLDRASFHYIRKLVEFDFVKADLPSADLMFASRIQQLRTQALKENKLADERYQRLVALVNEGSDRDAILAYLLHLSTENQQRNAEPAREQGFDGDEGQGRGYRDRGGDRGPRQGRDRFDRGNRRQRRDYDDREESYNEGNRGGNEFHQSEGDQGDQGEGSYQPRQERRREPQAPPKRDMRFYLGQGQADGVSKDLLEKLLKEANLGAELLQRTRIRKRYAFIDFPEEQTEAILPVLESATLPSGDKLFVRKATLINGERPAPEAPVEQNRESASRGFPSDDEESPGFAETERSEEE